MRGSMGPLDNDTLHVCDGDLALLCHSMLHFLIPPSSMIMSQDPMRMIPMIYKK